MVSQSRIWGAREEALSGLEGQLEVVGLELMRKVSWLVHIRRAGGGEFQILGAATLKLIMSRFIKKILRCANGTCYSFCPNVPIDCAWSSRSARQTVPDIDKLRLHVINYKQYWLLSLCHTFTSVHLKSADDWNVALPSFLRTINMIYMSTFIETV